ncbi:MAG: NADH-quinone oxidoreductase subunit J [Buchnera aphidicola (Schlechtendalia peitan)]
MNLDQLMSRRCYLKDNNMEFSFYSFGLLSIIFTVLTVFSKNPMYSLIHLTMSLLSTSGVLFSLGAFFAASLEVIIYAGAIMVLFIFVIMMFNFKDFVYCSDTLNRSVITLVSIVLLDTILAFISIFILLNLKEKYIFNVVIDTKSVGITLFNDYIVIIELASMLLLSALIVVFHIGKKNTTNRINQLG